MKRLSLFLECKNNYSGKNLLECENQSWFKVQAYYRLKTTDLGVEYVYDETRDFILISHRQKLIDLIYHRHKSVDSINHVGLVAET
jgi:hypothetical protein